MAFQSIVTAISISQTVLAIREPFPMKSNLMVLTFFVNTV